MDDKGVCKDCNNRKYCEDYKPNKWQCEDYEAQHTNEEWFCNLDTEDKAREISDMTAQGYWSEELVEKWLKEIHND